MRKHWNTSRLLLKVYKEHEVYSIYTLFGLQNTTFCSLRYSCQVSSQAKTVGELSGYCIRQYVQKASFSIGCLGQIELSQEGNPEASRMTHTCIAFIHVIAHCED